MRMCHPRPRSDRATCRDLESEHAYCRTINTIGIRNYSDQLNVCSVMPTSDGEAAPKAEQWEAMSHAVLCTKRRTAEMLRVALFCFLTPFKLPLCTACPLSLRY
ncbi:hypothetical protein DENSPDRAFT_343884 [Dentipellis sp. KUC8613]|nr:hypothetical protein DENSPDRAFT_343884 [Dentipellis sp. KUC8613]